MVKKQFQGVRFLVYVVWAVLVCEFTWSDTVGYWTFDNLNYGNQAGQSAAIPDSSPNNLTGVLGTPFSMVNQAPGVTGQATDFAVSLDGKGGVYADDSATELLNFQPPFTLEAWVRSDVVQTNDVGIVTYGIPGGRLGGGGWKLGLINGNIRFTLFAVVDLDSSVAVPFDGEWHHIATAYSDEGFVSYYLDGEEAEVRDEARAVTSPGAFDLNIGMLFNAISRFNGDIDRVRISNAFLTADQLDSDSATIKPVGDNTLAFFDFDEAALPFASEGQGTYSAISMQEKALSGFIPRNNMGLPTRQDDSPSGNAGDQSLLFDVLQLPQPQAYVVDPQGLLNFSTGDWTVEAWVNTDLFYLEPAGEERGVIFYYGRPGQGYSFSINADGRLQVTTLGKADLPSTLAIVPESEWTHVAVAHTAGEALDYFINGELMDTVSYTQMTNPAAGATLYIGSEWNGALPFSGAIDRIRISNSALSAEELDSVATSVNVSNWALY